MNKKIIQEKNNKPKTTIAVLVGFFISAFLVGGLLDIVPLTTASGYTCSAILKKCVCNGSDNDCNTMKTKECKNGTLEGTSCKQKFVNTDSVVISS